MRAISRWPFERTFARAIWAVLLACTGLSPIEAVGRDVVTGSTFSTQSLLTTNRSFASITDLPWRREILITSPDEGTVSLYSYDGSEVQTRVLPDRPGDTFVDGGQVFMMFEGVAPSTGRLAVFDPATFATNNVVTGLDAPLGLAKTGGNWYSTAGSGVNRRVVRLQPGSNTTVSLTTTFDSLLNFSNRLRAVGDQPGILYLEFRNAANPTLWALDLTSQLVTAGPMSNGSWAFVPGQVITGNGGFGYSRPGMAHTGWSWGPDNPGFVVVGAAASADYVALWTQRSFYRDINQITFHPTTGRWPELQRVTIPDLQTDAAAMLVTADSSRVALYTLDNGFYRLTIAGGVTSTGSPAAGGISSGRVGAPQAPGASVVGRAPASNAPSAHVVQSGADDIEFDSLGRGYVADSTTHSVNVYDTFGAPLASYPWLDRIQELVVINGEVFGFVPRRAQVVSFDLAKQAADVRCTNVFGNTLTSLGTDLYTWFPFRRIDPVTCSQFAFGPDSLGAPDTRMFSDGPQTTSLLTRGRVGSWTLVGGYIGSSTLIDSVRVPGLETAIDGSGRRFDATTLQVDGRVFPGNNPVASYEAPRLVATATNTISIYPYEGAGVATSSGTVTLPEPDLNLIRYEFQPGTGNLWVVRGRPDGSTRLDIVAGSTLRGLAAAPQLVLAEATLPDPSAIPAMAAESAPTNSQPASSQPPQETTRSIPSAAASEGAASPATTVAETPSAVGPSSTRSGSTTLAPGARAAGQAATTVAKSRGRKPSLGVRPRRTASTTVGSRSASTKTASSKPR